MHVSGTQLSINDRSQYLYHNSIYYDTFLILFYLFCCVILFISLICLLQYLLYGLHLTLQFF
jgi:hypothetical protein